MTNIDNIGTLSNKNSLNTTHAPLSFHFNSHLDVDYLEDYYQQNISDAAFMFDIFLNITVQKFHSFIALSLSNNYYDAFQLAHQMVPTFKLVGLTDIAFQLNELENRVRQSFCFQTLVKNINTDFSIAIPTIFIQKIEIDSFLKQQNF